MMNFGGAKSAANPARLAALKAAIIDGWSLSADTTVMIAELACVEPGCPPVETIFALLRKDSAPEKYTVHKPIAEITDDDIASLLRARLPAAAEKPA